MKKQLILFLTLLLCFPAAQVQAADWDHSARAMILYEPRTGAVLAEQNADQQMLIASTTKIMTALVVLEHCAMTDPVRVTAAQAAVEGSSMYLKAGETYTVEELLTGLLLVSGNDAALALAEHTAGSVEAFAALMNEKCSALKLENTHFANPHGLDDEAHYSSARDLARIMAAAMENSGFCRITASVSATVHGVRYVNHNKLLTVCPGCIGGKTGYTRAAGRVLVSCAEREGLRLICVTIADPDDWEDHCRAYDVAFAQWQYLRFPARSWQSLPLLSGLAEEVQLRCRCEGVLVPKSAALSVRAELPRFVFAPVHAGQVLGHLTVCADGSTVLETEIFCAETVDRDMSVKLRAKEQFQRAWRLYCRYGMQAIYSMDR